MSDARRLPAEWEPQQAVMLAWPHEGTDWAPMLDDVRACLRDIVEALTPSVDVLVLAPDVDDARHGLQGVYGAHRVKIVEMPTNDTWARDFGAITVIDKSAGNGPTTVPLDFTFNGWGMKFAADNDNLITSRLHARGAFACGIEGHRDMVLEGGSIESDGHGLILTTSQCLLSPNRNPWLSRNEIESRLLEAFGAKKMLWLDHGALAGDDTDSHIDTLVRIAPNDTLIYVGPPDDHTDPHYADLLAMREQLRQFTTLQGKPFNLIELPMADPVYDPEDGHRLPATYANYLYTNGAVLLPIYGSPKKDYLAARMMQAAHPGMEVRCVDCRALIRQHGSLHCMTMQFPVGTLRVHPTL